MGLVPRLVMPLPLRQGQVGSLVRVLFHNLISRISIYARRAAQLTMFHVMEFNLWPISHDI